MKTNEYIELCSMLYRNLCPSNTRVLQLQKIPSVFFCLHCSPLILLFVSLNYYHSIIAIFLLLFNNYFTSSSTHVYCPFRLCHNDLFFRLHLILNVVGLSWEISERIPRGWAKKLLTQVVSYISSKHFKSTVQWLLNIKGKMEIRH
jgi:hypothetical protein